MFAGCCGRAADEEEASVRHVNPLTSGEDDGGNFVELSASATATAEDVDDMIDACADGDHIQLQALLKRGVSPDSVDPDTGGTALMIAALNGQQQCLDVLLKHGAKVDAVEEEFGMTAFLWASHAAHLRCVERLIKAGCNIYVKEVSGLTAIDLAKENMRLGWERVVEIIKDEMTKSGDFTRTSSDSGGNSGSASMESRTVDAEHEKAVSAARNRRMARLIGETGHDEVDAMILSSEKLDTPTAGAAGESEHYLAKKLSALTPASMLEHGDTGIESADEVSRKSLNKSASSMHMAMANQKEKSEEESTREHLQVWEASEDLIGIIEKWMGRAAFLEPTVTKLLNDLAEECGGSMYGLDFKMKTKSSLARKVLEKTKGDSSQFEQVVEQQNDALRYTILFSTDDYIEGVKRVQAVFKQKGIKELKMKNFWRKTGEETDYLGINAVYLVPEEGGGMYPFELQFHTHQSIDTKMQKSHISYEKFRQEHSMAKAQYWEEMVRMWSLVPIPPGVQRLGTLVVHTVNLADVMAELTEEERKQIEDRRKLEDVVKPMCEWVASHTIKSEKKVTPILQKVATDVGATMPNMDFRVKSALSMMRKTVEYCQRKEITWEDATGVEAAVWNEQRGALRYTVVLKEKTYAAGVNTFLDTLKRKGFTEEFVYNFWYDIEPYNAIRTRLWSDDLQSWCLIVFHTDESLAMSSDRLAHHQNSMGLVFHTATFNKDMLETAVNALHQDKSWSKRCLGLKRPKGAKKIGKIVTHDVPADHWASKVKAFDDTDLAGKAKTTEDKLVKKLPPQIAEKYATAQEADQLGRISDAQTAYTECIELCDDALREKASKAISQVKEHSEARMVHMQMQSKRTVMKTAVNEYYLIVRLQRNYLRKHPRKHKSTDAATKPPPGEVGSKKLSSFKRPSG